MIQHKNKRLRAVGEHAEWVDAQGGELLLLGEHAVTADREEGDVGACAPVCRGAVAARRVCAAVEDVKELAAYDQHRASRVGAAR